MTKRGATSAVLTLLLAATWLTGCRRGEALVPVSGTVTLQGKPVADGIVTFSSHAKGVYVTARLDAQGHYDVRQAGGNGLPPGEYEVAITPAVPPALNSQPSASPPPPKGPKLVVIPLKYRDGKTSGLTLIVSETPGTLNVNMKP
jgi:hypothetical protein